MTIFNRPVSRQTFITCMTAVLLLAALFRIYHIIQRPIWTDEGTTTFNLFHFNGQTDLISGLAARDHHPPLYYLMLQGWVTLTGDSVFAMRYFAALVGILAVALMVPLARVFAAGHPRRFILPIAAALMLALSDPDIDLSQEIRFYTLRTLFIILSAFFYLRWLNRPTHRRALLWLLANVAILHTNYQGAFIMLFEGLHALIYLRGKQRLTALAWLAAAAVIFLPWFLGYGIGQFDNEQGVNSTLPSTWDTFVELVYKFLGRQWPLIVGLMLLGLLAYRPLARRKWLPDDRAALLIMWVALTLIISFVANEWFSILSPRRVMLISPAIALLVARGLLHFTPSTRLFLLAVIVAYCATTVDDYYPKAPWDKVGADMGRYAQSGDMGLMEIYYDDTVLYYYTDHTMPPGTIVKSLRMWRQFEPQTYPAGVLDLLRQHDTVWFTHWSPDQSGFQFLQETGHVQTALMTTYWGTNALNAYRFDVIQPQPVVDFTNGMRLRQFEMIPEKMRVDLWWSASAALDKDYSVSVFLLDASGQLVAQHDGFPFENNRPTTGWRVDEVIYDPHALQPADLPAGTYTVAVQLYTYYDGLKYPTLQGDDWHVLGTIQR